MRHQKELFRTMMRDDLTGLPTKEQHKAEATAILAGSREKYAYISCDIVDFKVFNETYGYTYGNVALKYTAAVWRSFLKESELLSRTTQDHFCMLLRYETEGKLRERLYGMLERAADFPVDSEGGRHRASFRCGVYVIHGDEDINKIRSRADMARKSGEKMRNNFVTFYDGDSLAKELEERELEAELRLALERRELEVFYQPKVDIKTEKVGGAEALIRWNHPQKGMISPGVFIPLCEENGFICELDFYVLDEVCRQLLQWKISGRQLLKISVNFSRMHLYHADFVDRLIEKLTYYHLDPSMIEIEITESAVYNEMDTMLDTMKRIKQAGFGLSMDDFGSGYSSLNLLRVMPVDVLKLDKGFLENCSGDDSTREKRIIAHVISMAKDLDITVLAEGVETEQQKEFLKESRCDMIQGFYYAKPMPVEQFMTYIGVKSEANNSILGVL